MIKHFNFMSKSLEIASITVNIDSQDNNLYCLYFTLRSSCSALLIGFTAK